MKKIKLLITVLISFYAINVHAQSGVNFVSGTLQDALNKAKAENKLVFIYANMNGCNPCETTVKEIFTQKELSDYINQNFVCFKFDIATKEGYEIRMKYQLNYSTTYPSYIFSKPDGNAAYKAIGYRKAEPLLGAIKRALDPKMHLENLQDRYNNGERSLDFLADYFTVLRDAGKNDQEVLGELVEGNGAQFLTEEGISFLLKNINSIYYASFDFLMNNRAKLNVLAGEQELSDKIYKLYEAAYLSSKKNKYGKIQIDDSAFKRAVRAIKASDYERSKELALQAYIFRYREEGEIDKYIETVTNYVTVIRPENWTEYNEYAWFVYENVNDKEVLQKAVAWAEKSISLNDNSYNEDTLASLLYKLKRYSEAEQAAVRSMELANANGEDATGTEKLLQKIRAAK